MPLKKRVSGPLFSFLLAARIPKKRKRTFRLHFLLSFLFTANTFLRQALHPAGGDADRLEFPLSQAV